MTTSLRKNQEGAIIVMGLVMAIFLIGLLYYGMGIGNSIMYRESMQDGADASAFSAAVMHARGMNMIVMFNMVMAALLAILVALKLISAVCIVLIGLLAVAAFWGCLPCATVTPEVNAIRTEVDALYDDLKDPILTLLEVLHCGEIGLRYGIPLVAQARTIGEVSQAYNPPVKLGVIWPIYAQLPVEDDEFKKLCDKAGEYAGELASIPFQALGIGFLIKEPIKALAETFPNYFCGANSGTGDPSSYTYDKQIPQPRLNTPSYDKCYGDDPNKDNTEQACQEARQEIENSYPVGERAECQNELCEERVKNARTECDPSNGKNLSTYMWYERDVTRYYTKDKSNRVYELEEKRKYGPSETVGNDTAGSQDEVTMPEGNSKRPPCGYTLAASTYRSDLKSSWTDWNKNIHEPLCHEVFEKPDPWQMAPGEEIAVKYKEIQHAAACVEETKVTVSIDETLGKKTPMQDSITVDGAGSSSDSGSDNITCFSDDDYARSPQRVPEGTLMGEEDFQLRSIVIGENVKDDTRKMLKIAAWGKKANDFSSSLISLLQKTSIFGLAQAEFYYNGDTDAGEWMWHMKWRARLRRFRLPQGETQTERASITDSAGGACFHSEAESKEPPSDDSCSTLSNDRMMETLNELILH